MFLWLFVTRRQWYKIVFMFKFQAMSAFLLFNVLPVRLLCSFS